MKSRKLALLPLMLLAGCVAGDSVPPRAEVTISQNFKPGARVFQTVAVLVKNKSTVGINQGFLSDMQRVFVKAALQKGYIVANRSDLQEIVKELDFQRSGVTEQEVARRARILGVQAILIVSLDSISTRDGSSIIQMKGTKFEYYRVSMSATLLSAEKAEILYVSDLAVEEFMANGDKLSLVIDFLARAISDTLPPA